LVSIFAATRRGDCLAMLRRVFLNTPESFGSLFRSSKKGPAVDDGDCHFQRLCGCPGISIGYEFGEFFSAGHW
jgi:hypothetical protein